MSKSIWIFIGASIFAIIIVFILSYIIRFIGAVIAIAIILFIIYWIVSIKNNKKE